MSARLAILAALIVGALMVGCAPDESQKGLVDSQKKIDEANKKLAEQSGIPAQEGD